MKDRSPDEGESLYPHQTAKFDQLFATAENILETLVEYYAIWHPDAPISRELHFVGLKQDAIDQMHEKELKWCLAVAVHKLTEASS